MSDTETSAVQSDDCDYDVVVVGGGPAGCSAGVFTARYGLDTLVFDRGRSSLQRCAHLENYLGFPAGIGIETLYSLMHDHVEEAGCTLVSDLVESVTRRDAGEGFVVDPQEGNAVTARRVVAATRYDGSYLRPLDDGMFVESEHGGEPDEEFDRSYADADGSTPVAGLYVTSPSEESDRQAIIAAGRGARVALTLIEDLRRERGYFGDVAKPYDWVRRTAELTDEWADPERWREYLDAQRPDEHDVDASRWTELREAEIERRLDAYVSDETIDTRDERSQRRLLDHVDDELILERARELDAS
ncbi:FAD-dependent oxidoreductase [Haloprofundus salinisoli]|uniref:FAD-dependent oxidoreductase n=1 Tax=Haloprofundus salinisoli TaxID=2876193 RepID=UPI001CCF4B0F|nr:FAD-dependent oxidoreductase [Haloprofundus salinisoli]